MGDCAWVCAELTKSTVVLCLPQSQRPLNSQKAGRESPARSRGECTPPSNKKAFPSHYGHVDALWSRIAASMRSSRLRKSHTSRSPTHSKPLLGTLDGASISATSKSIASLRSKDTNEPTCSHLNYITSCLLAHCLFGRFFLASFPLYSGGSDARLAHLR